jgi:tetratricopeptide (TPR) repeat protein
MGLMNKIKKSLELKQNTPSSKSLKLTQKKILKLKKQFELNTNNPKILIELYSCYVEISDLDKKIECLKKLSDISPNDFYPLQQLADIYLNELDDEDEAKIYQNKANSIKNDF